MLQTHAFVFPKSQPVYDRAEGAELAFNIYPTCEHAQEINRIIWKSAHNQDVGELRNFTGLDVVAVAIPIELHDFLRAVTWEQAVNGVVDFLKLLQTQFEQDGDLAGMRQMHCDIVEDIWERVENADEVANEGRAEVLDCLVQLCFMTPWKTEILVYHIAVVEQGTNHEVFMKMLWRDLAWFKLYLRGDGERRRRAMQRCLAGGMGELHACVREVSGCGGMFARLPVDVVQTDVVACVILQWANNIPKRCVAEGNRSMMNL